MVVRVLFISTQSRVGTIQAAGSNRGNTVFVAQCDAPIPPSLAVVGLTP